MNSSVQNKVYWLLLLSAGVLFYVLNLQTPFSHDDYAYCFYYGPDSNIIRPTGIRITGFWQMLESMWHHYLCVNGRFSSHLLLQSFCAFLGKGTFNLANTAVFMVFLHTLVSLSGWKHSVPLLATVFLSSFFLPFPGQTMLWMTGSLNYLWPTAFSLVWLFWLKKTEGKPLSPWTHAAAFLVCLAIGWSNESVTVPVTVGLFLFFVFNRESFRHGAVSSFLGYALGAALIAFSSGTHSRLQPMEELYSNLLQTLFIHAYNLTWGFLRSVWPVLALALMVFYVSRHNRSFKIMRKNLYGWLFCGFCLFLFALGWDQSRVYFGVAVLSLLILLRFAGPYLTRWGERWYICLILVVLGFLPASKALRTTSAYNHYEKNVIKEIQLAPTRCIVTAQPFKEKSRYVYDTYLEPDRNAFHNRVKSFYYGKSFIQALPKDLYDAVRSGTLDSLLTPSEKKVNNQRLYGFNDYWLLPVPDLPKTKISASYHYHTDNSALKPRQRFVRSLLNTLDISSKQQPCYGVETAFHAYLVLPIDSSPSLYEIILTDNIK